MATKVYSFNLEERVVNSIPIQNKSQFVQLAIAAFMIDYLDFKEQEQRKNSRRE